jgi:alkanesulfonate monooxygenase SsuD/methylene tetrahydromethanopterin reductase-like flavin-dependent oxidoreductase (luciferase family)
VLDEAALATGRHPAAIRILAVMHTVIRPSREEARSVMREGLRYTGMPFYQREYEREGLSAPGGIPDDPTIDAISIAGPADYAREQIALWHDAGVDLLLLADTYNEPDPEGAYLGFAELD